MARSITLQPEVHPFATTARVRPRGRAVLPVADYDLLLEYLEICERDRDRTGPCLPMSCRTGS